MYDIYFANYIQGEQHSDCCPAEAKIYDVNTCIGDREETLVYSDSVAAEYHYIHNPKLTLSKNSAGTLTFDIYKDRLEAIQANEWLKFMTTEIMVVKNDTTQPAYIIWTGRLTVRDRDINGTYSCTCEGDLNYLYDVTLTPEWWSIPAFLAREIAGTGDKGLIDPNQTKIYENDYQFIRHMIIQYNYHIHQYGEYLFSQDNGTCSDHETKFFEFGKLDETLDPVWSTSDDQGKTFSEISTVYDRIMDFVNDADATIYITYSEFGRPCKRGMTNYKRRKYLNVISGYPVDESTGGEIDQIITFKRNLLDYADTLDATYMHTFTYPVGAEIGTDESQNDLPRYNTAVNYSEHLNNYFYKNLNNLPYFICKAYNYETADDEKLYNAMVNYQKQLSIDQTTLTLTAVDLNYISHTPSFDFLQPVRVVSDVNNIDAVYYIDDMAIDMQNPSNNTISLNGTRAEGISNLVAQIGKISEMLDAVIDV